MRDEFVTRISIDAESQEDETPGITIPPGFIERIKYQSACIPISVAGIMRMSYPRVPKGIGERCTYAECQLNKKILGMEKR